VKPLNEVCPIHFWIFLTIINLILKGKILLFQFERNATSSVLKYSGWFTDVAVYRETQFLMHRPLLCNCSLFIPTVQADFFWSRPYERSLALINSYHHITGGFDTADWLRKGLFLSLLPAATSAISAKYLGALRDVE